MDNAISAEAKGPPLHHHDFDEAFYVLDGELTFQLGDDVFTRGPGEIAFAPRGVPHAFANHSGAAARMLLVCTPAGLRALLPAHRRARGGRRAAAGGPPAVAGGRQGRAADRRDR